MTAMVDLILYYFLDQTKLTCFAGFWYTFFMHIWRSFARPQVKTLIVKLKLLSRKNPISEGFFQIFTHFTHFLVPTSFLPTSYTIILLKGVEWKFWVWLFYKNMKDVFSEGLPYITHLVVLHSFLRRPQILLKFIRDLTLMKRNLIK